MINVWMRVLHFVAGVQAASVSLDLGWRFYRGVPIAECTSTFSTNYTTFQCDGLQNGPSAKTAGDCEALCCADLSCQIWQWLGGGGEGAGCWYGVIPPQGCNPNTPWLSYANASRGVEVPGWAALSFPDTPATNWTIVDLPHDFIITGSDPTISPYDRSAEQGQAFIPKSVGAYRKHFAVPSEWQGQHIELYVEGMYAFATYYLNGAYLGTHALGYTSFFARLDNSSVPLIYGGGANILAVFVDATAARDTGWWYEGGGGCRHTFLTASPPAAHIVPHGLHADVSLTGGFAYPASPSDGVVARMATVLAFAEVESDSSASPSASFTLFDSSGSAVASAAAKAVALSPAAPTGTLVATLQLANASAWSVGRPYLYTLSATLGGGGGHTVNASIGLRSVRWDADEGVFINEQRVRFRAFCDHESFTAVGMAVPDRLNLFRYQAMRGMGGNGRRFSHNPPAPALLALADRLGLLTLDENRVFALGLSPNMVDLVQRDRNHPSVIFWSFCNEPGCNNNDKTAPQQPTQDFKYAAVVNDGTRAVTGNMCVNWGSCPNLADYVSEAGLNMSLQLDVQGFSHVDTGVFEAYHARWPAKPLVASECCSCETQRGEANDLPFNKTLVFYSEFNADCVARETNWALGLDYVAGSFVWTAFDYYGEPDSWPHISSSFGSYDLAGFPKAAVWWYRSWWLANVSAADAGRPPLPAPSSSLFVHIVESWRGAPGGTRDINVFTNAPVVRLSLNGAPVGQPLPVPPFGYARFAKVPYAPGKLLAEALDASGASVLGAHARASWGAPAGIKLMLDAPSPRTGTGGALFLDGGDAALVRATVVDAAGAPCEDSSLRVAFRVTSGPGVVWGTGNGDPANQEPNHAPSRAAYHGLVRAVVRVTQASAVAGGGDGALALLAAVNVDAGGGPASSAIKPLAGPPPLITVSASAPGLPAATLDIPTSVADADGVLAVAAANVLAADVTD